MAVVPVKGFAMRLVSVPHEEIYLPPLTFNIDGSALLFFTLIKHM